MQILKRPLFLFFCLSSIVWVGHCAEKVKVPTYTDPKSNPKAFELSPGRYRVSVKAVRLEGRPSKQLEVTVEAGQTVEEKVDLGS